MEMTRNALKDLSEWLDDENRKPLILRGARQVGKTWLVRALARERDLLLIELNFEQHPDFAGFFKSNDPQKILLEIGIWFGKNPVPEKTLLFLDEIQAAPELIGKLRWFYEQMPALPVIAAGSLLEFALADSNFSMPVGRVSFYRLFPLSFGEFVAARGNAALTEYLKTARKTFQVPEPIHKKALDFFREYCIVGGMPAVVADWCAHQDDQRRKKLQNDILISHRDDFNKYRNRIPLEALQDAFRSIPQQLGERFMYSKIESAERAGTLKKAILLLEKSGVCSRIFHSDLSGIPIGAGICESIFKILFLDTGLAQSALGLGFLDWSNLENAVWRNKGAVAEQIVGQLLREHHEDLEQRMYFWKQKGGMNGEVDYAVQKGSEIIPVEVKAGTSGSMKSLHFLMKIKNFKKACRFDLNPPSKMHVRVKTTQGDPVEYELESFPLYMCEWF